MNIQQSISNNKCSMQPRITARSRLYAYLKDVCRKRRQNKARRKTLRELKRLDAHILNDIGVDRRTLTTIEQKSED